MGGITDSQPVLIALGSNLGDRPAALAAAVDRLSLLVTDIVLSDIIETVPVGAGLEEEPLFLNAVVTGSTTLAPRALLDGMLAIERELGRERPYPGAARIIDLDLVLYGDRVVNEPGLEIPHPRFRDRVFVLGPAAGIAPDLRDPVTGLRVGELLKALLRRDSD